MLANVELLGEGSSEMREVVLATPDDIVAWRLLAVEVEPLFGPLVGGLLWSAHPPRYRIGWLAIARQARRQGVGRHLVTAALAWVMPPATVEVVTFGDDDPAGLPARRFYLALGFRPAEAAPAGPVGGSRQVFRLTLPPL